MAYTWIGSIRHARMDRTVNYAVNPVKTAYNAQRSEDASMTRNIAYALNPEKGTTKLYQTAINLDSVETAWREMKTTKERWSKTDGIQGFHVVQSFKPGEITPDLAHRIGVEFVEKCFPGFEAVVGTHLDHAHIHNHIVLNSVNCVDGHKYHSSQKSYYAELREVSDDLCRKYGLSIIPPDDIGKRRQAYAEWQAERNGQPTWCSAIKQDVDEVLARSLSFEQFVRLLRERGYEVKTGVKHMAVRPPGKERFTRLRRLGDDYTEEAIRQRILHNDPAKIPAPPKAESATPKVYRARYAGSFRKTRKKKVRGLMALYLWYTYLLRLNPDRGAYNVYCFCYRADWLAQHMAKAQRGIRFITPGYGVHPEDSEYASRRLRSGCNQRHDHPQSGERSGNAQADQAADPCAVPR